MRCPDGRRPQGERRVAALAMRRGGHRRGASATHRCLLPPSGNTAFGCDTDWICIQERH